MEALENIVTIISFEEFNDLIKKTGDDELTIIELIDAIVRINGEIYAQTNSYGST